MPKAKVKTGNRRQRAKMSRTDDHPPEDAGQLDAAVDHISQLSLELLERIFDYLPLRTIISCERLNRHFQMAIQSYLKVLKQVDLTENEWHGYVPGSFTLSSIVKILKQCPQLEVIRGLHFRQNRSGLHFHVDGSDQLVRGIIKELRRCRNLRQVEVSSLYLVEALMEHMPDLDLGCFSNRGEFFETECRPYFTLCPGYHISKLHLTGVILPELPETPHLEEVTLEWVELTSSQPFQNFICPALRTFVMRNCFGPLNALKYVALIDNLARCVDLERLELVRVPFLGGLIQHRVEETAQEHTQGFHNLKSIIVSGCKNCTEQDLGYLLLAASKSLENLSLQPCLTKDSLFLALRAVEVKFFNLRTLCLGYVDPWSNSGKYTTTELVSHGLAEITENPALMTDMGMKAMGLVFPNILALTVHNCPHLRYPRGWLDVEPVDTCWSQLTSLHLRHCHGIQLHDGQSLPRFLEWLPSLEDIHLERMFPKPPKGCSRVGLSAGTGIGVSSALVAMQNPGAQQAQQPQNQAEVQVPNVAPINQDPPRHQENVDREAAQAFPGNPQVQQAGVQIPERQMDPPAVHRGRQDTPHGSRPQAGDLEEEMDQQCGDSKNANNGDGEQSNTDKKHLSRGSGVMKDSGSSTDSVESDTEEEPTTESRDSKVGTSEGCHEKHHEVATASSQSVSDTNGSAMNARAVQRRSESASGRSRRPDPMPKRNVRDAATSAVAIRPACPIHGSMVQNGSDDDGENSISSEQQGHEHSGRGTPDSQEVGVQVRQDSSRSRDSRPQMCDQATSTSDPVMEPDPVLVFKCTSQTLRSVTFDECGISHIDMLGCPNLKSIQGHNLPIFKQLRLSGPSSNVTRLQFEQCPKMHLADAMQQLVSCHPADRFLRFRPMYRSAAKEVENVLCSGLPNLDCHALFIVDGTSPPQAHHSTAIQDWMHLLSRLNQELVFSDTLETAGRKMEEDENEESERRTPALQRVVDDDQLTILTDIPWMKLLVKDGCFQLGKPPPFGADSTESLSKLREHLSGPITMAVNRLTPVFPHIFCVYVQMSDADGTAIPGEFMSYYN